MFILGSTIKYNRSQVPLSATNTLNNCTTNNSAQTVYLDSPYSATITADIGYTLDGASVLIIMGGVDITSTAYNNGSISIEKVSGPIGIEITAHL